MKIASRIAQIMIAASVVTTMVACAPTQTREGTGEYIDDSVITAKVKAAFVNDPAVKATEINVETFKGEVQLSGFVAQPADAQRAADIARGVKGVKSVKNDVRVK
ncbi:MAG: BON domain-containing protein [Telluria sp.]